jgi:hypothetical protein
MTFKLYIYSKGTIPETLTLAQRDAQAVETVTFNEIYHVTAAQRAIRHADGRPFILYQND